jgi:hypothetical protein
VTKFVLLIAAYFYQASEMNTVQRWLAGGSVPVEGMKRKNPSLSACHHDLSYFRAFFSTLHFIQELHDVNGGKDSSGHFFYSVSLGLSQ